MAVTIRIPTQLRSLAGFVDARASERSSWGAVSMPAQPQVRDADARSLVQWILGGAK